MSEAALFKDKNLDRPVVIKKLKPGQDTSRILDEIAALQKIRSPYVVQIYDLIRDTQGTVEAIVEEYLPGADLSGSCGVTDPDRFLTLAYSVAKGVADIHAAGQVHRDLKLENMKFDVEGCLKIFDFGLSRDVTKAETLNVIGTRGYMAPELFKPNASGLVKFTSAVDVFAFGAIALKLALKDFPPDFCKLPPRLPCGDADFAKAPVAVPREIAAMLNACIEPDPFDRPEMGEVAELLSNHILRDQHKALIVSRGRTYTLDKANKKIRLNVAGQGGLTIAYSGMGFSISDIVGNVVINNSPARDGATLPGACVIVLGDALLGTQRTNITVDVSHPEVLV